MKRINDFIETLHPSPPRQCDCATKDVGEFRTLSLIIARRMCDSCYDNLQEILDVVAVCLVADDPTLDAQYEWSAADLTVKITESDSDD